MAEIAADKLRRRFYVVSSADLMASKTFAVRKFAAALHRLMTLKTSVVRVLPVRNAEIYAFTA